MQPPNKRNTSNTDIGNNHKRVIPTITVVPKTTGIHTSECLLRFHLSLRNSLNISYLPKPTQLVLSIFCRNFILTRPSCLMLRACLEQRHWVCRNAKVSSSQDGLRRDCAYKNCSCFHDVVLPILSALLQSVMGSIRPEIPAVIFSFAADGPFPFFLLLPEHEKAGLTTSRLS